MSLSRAFIWSISLQMSLLPSESSSDLQHKKMCGKRVYKLCSSLYCPLAQQEVNYSLSFKYYCPACPRISYYLSWIRVAFIFSLLNFQRNNKERKLITSKLGFPNTFQVTGVEVNASLNVVLGNVWHLGSKHQPKSEWGSMIICYLWSLSKPGYSSVFI